MNTLDLTNKKSEKYKISEFPDGQQQVTISSYFEDEVLIKSRLNNFLDLELIICAVKSLRENKVNNIALYVPYFLGSRSDRKFQFGENNYLKDVICPIINSLQVNLVKVLNPHSDVLEACLNNFVKQESHEFEKWALQQINNKSNAQETTIFLSPDGGALKKIYKTAEYVNFKGTIINCNKVRETTGQITKTEVPEFDLTKDVVIFDDICDGGRTFIEIAKIIRSRHICADHGKIHLVVTHGIFSKGLKELSEYFDGIFTTNSYQEINSITDFGMRNERYLNKVKQFNIF